ncbi:MAG: copper transporter [Acidimicrobiia bacterium]
MINFRFHIVSLIAIFLALALGVVIGAGVIDRGVVDTLNDRLDRVEAKSDQQQLLNDILTAANQRDDEFIELFQPWGLEGRLTGEVVAFVAVRGVDEARVQATIAAAEQAGAGVSGVLWIEEKWGAGSDDARALATSIGAPTLRSTKLREAAWSQLATRLARPPLVSSDAAPDLLATLSDGGFVSYQEVDGGLAMSAFPGRGTMFVLVTGEDADVPNDEVVMPAARAFSAQSLGLVIGDVFADLELAPARGDVFDTLRDSGLARTISTVDDLDLTQGPATVALTLVGLACAPPVVGHYGYGGADIAPLPEFTSACPGTGASTSAR